jgi:phosphoglycerate dehydrogenase-like enzyme
MSTNLLLLLTFTEDIRQQYLSGLAQAFPNVDIQVVDHHSKVSPFIKDADILMTFGPMMTEDVLRKAQNLKWIQALGSGVDGVTDRKSLSPNVLITNMYGIHGAPVSEAALMSMLALARNLPWTIRNQLQHQWDRSLPPSILEGKTVTIFGIGIISSALAPKCKALGMRVLGVSSKVRSVEGFDQVYPKEVLMEVVQQSDYFVLLTPYSPDTHHIINTEVLKQMKPSAFLVNLARGGVVDEAALIECLTSRQIAGAALDVFQEEPLQSKHAFWSMDNVLVTPHLGGFYDGYVHHALPIMIHNLHQFIKKDYQSMKNIVRLPKE